MAANISVAGAPAVSRIPRERSRLSSWSQTLWSFCRKKPLGAVGGAIMVILIFVAIFAESVTIGPTIGAGGIKFNLPGNAVINTPGLVPYDPLQVNPKDKLMGPTDHYKLGTDQLGRDLLSRIISGSRISLEVGVFAVMISTILGAIVGMTTGYFRGPYDMVAQRFVDAIQAFPYLVLAMSLVAIFGPSLTIVTLSLGLVFTPSVARVIRGSTLSIRQQQYIESTRAIGSSAGRIIFRHILPNLGAPLIVLASIQLGAAILAEASLSFLGLGPPPPAPTWGSMLSNARKYMESAPYLAIFPGIAISLAVLGFNMLGDALRDVLDPRMRGS